MPQHRVCQLSGSSRYFHTDGEGHVHHRWRDGRTGRNVIRERVRAGVRNAKRNGKQLGRKHVIFDRAKAVELHAA